MKPTLHLPPIAGADDSFKRADSSESPFHVHSSGSKSSDELHPTINNKSSDDDISVVEKTRFLSLKTDSLNVINESDSQKQLKKQRKKSANNNSKSLLQKSLMQRVGSGDDDTISVTSSIRENDSARSSEKVKPLHFDKWVRSLDQNQTVYYYNTATGESSWLAPCNVCFKNADKYCVDCKLSYCDKHHEKRHRKIKRGETAHTWTTQEADTEKEELPSDGDLQEYCIECQLKIATKLCDECWDPYCDRCFTLVHHVGALLHHNGHNYHRAKKSWYVVRKFGQGPDYYVDGEHNNESTFDKPEILMTELEKTLLGNFKVHQAAAEGYVKQIEELQFELEKAKYERDQLMVENAALAQNGGVNKGKGNESKKSRKTAHQTDDNDSNKDVNGAHHRQEVFVLDKMRNEETDDYRQKLLSPSDRRRGKGRTDYIKSVLEAPVPR